VVTLVQRFSWIWRPVKLLLAFRLIAAGLGFVGVLALSWLLRSVRSTPAEPVLFAAGLFVVLYGSLFAAAAMERAWRARHGLGPPR
jgi:hypothetical protein